MEQNSVPTYDPSISRKKGVQGGVEGAVIAVVTTVIIAVIKNNVQVDPTMENALAVGVASVVSGAVLGLFRFVNNVLKHK